MTPKLEKGQHIHLIGIGGTGISAIARVLILQGYKVSGSDLRTNAETQRLQSMGATIYEGHAAAQVNGADVVITTSAAKPDHVEIVAAKAQNIPVYKRNDIISALMDGCYEIISVAGTHGKTTTTSMIVHILNYGGEEPSYIAGGVLGNTGENANVGKEKYFVIEADEYDNMFHGLNPHSAVITSLEYDHPDFFKSEDEMVASFEKFVQRMATVYNDNFVLLNKDYGLAYGLKDVFGIDPPYWLSYSIKDNTANYFADNIRYENDLVKFDIIYEQDENYGTITLNIPGEHNIANALAAVAIVIERTDVPFKTIAEALATFKTTGRRFDIRDEVNEIVVVDDYAHHPSAIKLVVDAARKRYPDREVWAVWQPHTYSRTQELWDDYLAAFDDAHHVLVTEIYASRETFNPDVNGSDFVAQLDHSSKYHADSFDNAVETLLRDVKPKSVILIMSAGDAPQIGIDYLERLRADNE